LNSCQRSQMLTLGDGYSLGFFNSQHTHMSAPPPQARSFELTGDRVHYAPHRPADVKHVKLEITLDFEQESVSGTVTTTFVALYEEVKTIAFDAIDLHIERVTLNRGKELQYSADGKKLFVTLDRPYQHGEEFNVAIEYDVRPRTGMHFIKPAPEDPTRPVQAWTFGQPSYHSYWFPCHDAPNDRATSEIIVTAPAQFITVSNGNLLGVTDNGNTKIHHWRHDIPHAAYLISLVVGEFAVIEDSYNGKPVNYYVRPDRKNDARFYMGKTPEMMRFFSEYTGVEYPYDKYAQTVVEIYTGAMEHTTCTTHSFMLLLDERAALDFDYVPVVAHELAHQWFGDLVTCRDWANGWLNEGFATYFEELWGRHDQGEDYFKQSMLDLLRGYVHEDEEYRRPIVYSVYHSDGFELFDGHMYNKGAWVLHMLCHQLGETAFRRAVKTYLERYREREVITADLERTFEEVTGRSLAQFFQQWVYQGGYPAFEVHYSWDSEHTMVKLNIKQTQKVDDLTPCFITPIDLAFTVPTSDEAAKDEHTAETRTVRMRVISGEDGQVEQSFYVSLEREPLMIRFDPDGHLLKTLKFNRPARMLRYQLAHDGDVLGRIEAAEALGGDAGEERQNVEALKTALFQDAFWGVRVAVASALGNKGNEQAQAILLSALSELSAPEFSRVRAAICSVLGKYQAPQQAEQAERAAQALYNILERGDISYRVESAAAEALGKTRTANCVDHLLKFMDRPCWNDVLQQGICRGLAATGEDRVVDTLAGYLYTTQQPLLLRFAAARGMMTLAGNGYLYSEEARQRAVTALSTALEHDSWEPIRAVAAQSLGSLGEKRVIGVLERVANYETETRAQRDMRLAAHKLRTVDKADEQLKQLRKDLDEVREENRKLREQVGALEGRIK
jgi:aminopeptidase N